MTGQEVETVVEWSVHWRTTDGIIGLDIYRDEKTARLVAADYGNDVEFRVTRRTVRYSPWEDALQDRYGSSQGTHWHGCHQWHPECAAIKGANT